MTSYGLKWQPVTFIVAAVEEEETTEEEEWWPNVFWIGNGKRESKLDLLLFLLLPLSITEVEREDNELVLVLLIPPLIPPAGTSKVISFASTHNRGSSARATCSYGCKTEFIFNRAQFGVPNKRCVYESNCRAWSIPGPCATLCIIR